MPLIEIVSHCWAKDLPQYAQALNYQISSLLLCPPKNATVCLTICYCEEDRNTTDVLDWAGEEIARDVGSGSLGDAFRICFISHLFKGIGRRSIGRNQAALHCIGDIVWFADVDQVFRDGILDRLVEMEWPEDVVMIYPKMIHIHKDHKTGDESTSAVDLRRLGLVDVDPGEFVPKKYRKAIGGVQIVKGDFAREHGYLNGIEKWQRQTDNPFGDFRDDVAYRNYCLQFGEIRGVDLPGLYRIRHSRTTYQ